MSELDAQVPSVDDFLLYGRPAVIITGGYDGTDYWTIGELNDTIRELQAAADEWERRLALALIEAKTRDRWTNTDHRKHHTPRKPVKPPWDKIEAHTTKLFKEMNRQTWAEGIAEQLESPGLLINLRDRKPEPVRQFHNARFTRDF